MSGNVFDIAVTTTRRSASGNENDLSRTPFTAVKTAVFAPTPIAIVTIASNEKPGCLISARALWRKSFQNMSSYFGHTESENKAERRLSCCRVRRSLCAVDSHLFES